MIKKSKMNATNSGAELTRCKIDAFDYFLFSLGHSTYYQLNAFNKFMFS